MCGGTARPVHLRRVLRWQSALDPTRGAEHHDGERFLSERVSMRILLVEDQKKLAAHIARGLAEDGHIVDSVHDGDVACDQGEAVAYDVIVLDWSLPGRDGLSVLRHWRQRGLRTPVLMLTARATLEERVLALRTGADRSPTTNSSRASRPCIVGRVMEAAASSATSRSTAPAARCAGATPRPC